MPLPDLLSTTEAADLIGCERSTLSRWVQLGRMATVRKLPGRNGAVLFDRAEVDRVAAEYATTGTLADPSPASVGAPDGDAQ